MTKREREREREIKFKIILMVIMNIEKIFKYSSIKYYYI